MRCRFFRSGFSFCLVFVLAPCLIAQDSFLLQDRFKVEATWKSPEMPVPQVAEGGTLTSQLGYFHFFDPGQVELLVRVLDGCSVNNNFWVFAAGLTDHEVTLTVTDTQTGSVRTYNDPAGLAPFSSITDTGAFTTCPQPFLTQTVGTPPNHSEKMIGLLNGRFQVSVTVNDPDGQPLDAQPQLLTNSTAGFGFLEENSQLDAFVKIVDGTSTNGSFWVYLSSLNPVALTYTVIDNATDTRKTYTQPAGTLLSYIDRQFEKADSHRWIFPWISNNTIFGSRLIVNNFSPNPISVTLLAILGDGTNTTIERSIPGGGFLNERASDLFGSFGGGQSYSVTMTASEPSLAGRWVTENLRTESGGSPSQGVAVKFDGGESSDDSRNARLGNSLMFGYLPNDGDTIAAPVIVNTGSNNANVTLYFFNTNGNLLGTETIENLIPQFPYAAVLSDLLPGVEGDVSMVAHTRNQPLTGVVFTFNSQLEPSLGNAEAIPFVPPGSKQ